MKMFLSVWRKGTLRRATGHLVKQNVSFSSGNELINVQVNDGTGVATVTMQRAPVNGLNLELCSALLSTFKQLESNKCRGMILTSASPTVFSAGLDILEIYKPDQDRAVQFWKTLQDMWLTLYSSPYPTVAAINGHSPAGGCLIAISCEYRVMVQGKCTIGLNETQLGIIPPKWFMDSYRNVLPQRTAELALTTGKLFSAEEALSAGLIDQLATDKADALAKAEKFLSAFAKIRPAARSMTKTLFRQDTIKWLEENKEFDLNLFLTVVNNAKVQQALGLYLESLKKK